ncbi:hypothetical protein AAG906_002830 [Vitis piasezkii]
MCCLDNEGPSRIIYVQLLGRVKMERSHRIYRFLPACYAPPWLSKQEHHQMQPVLQGPFMSMQHMHFHPAKLTLKVIEEGWRWALVIYNNLLALPSTQHNNALPGQYD